MSDARRTIPHRHCSRAKRNRIRTTVNVMVCPPVEFDAFAATYLRVFIIIIRR